MNITAIAPWFGAKRTDAPFIARQCCLENGRPPKAFWDLCCGSMAVSLAMPKCSHHHAVDLHGELINLAEVIKDSKLGPALYRRLRRTLSCETFLEEARRQLADEERPLFGGDTGGLDPLERAYWYFVVAWQARNGAAGTARNNTQPAVRWTSGGGHGAIRFKGAVDSIPAWRRRMRTINVLKRDIFVVLERIEDQVGTVIYIDPPYIRDGARSGGCVYLHEFTTQHHERLARLCRRFDRVRVVVSYYEHPALHDLYDGWTFIDRTRQKNLHAQNRRGAAKLDAPEILIINGPCYADDNKGTQNNGDS